MCTRSLHANESRGECRGDASLQMIKTEGRNKHVWSTDHNRAQSAGRSEHPMPAHVVFWRGLGVTV